MIAVAEPLTAQPSASSNAIATESRQVNPSTRVIDVPGHGAVYVVPAQPRNTRSPRQRCVDEEIAREGGSPSALAMGAIDLKCSQR